MPRLCSPVRQLWSSANPPHPIPANTRNHFPSSNPSCSSFPHPGHREPPPPLLWSGVKDILWESWNAELPLVQSCFLRKGKRDLMGRKHGWVLVGFIHQFPSFEMSTNPRPWLLPIFAVQISCLSSSHVLRALLLLSIPGQEGKPIP